MAHVAQKGSVQSQPNSTTWLSCLVPLIIFFLTVVAFFPVLQNGFVSWDDDRNLLENLHYRGLGWTQLRWMFTTFHMSLYRPLTWVTLGLDYLLWAMNPFGYHLTSLLLHAVNAVLFYFVSLRILRLAVTGPTLLEKFRFKAAAGSAALIFSLHPLRVEAVAWASARNDVLSALFFLSTIIFYLRANAVPQGGRARRHWMIGAVILYALSLLSKAIGMTLPIVLLVLDIYPLRRLGGDPRKWFGPAARWVWWEKVPFLLLALAAGVVGLVTKQEAGTAIPFAHYGIALRLSQAFFGLAFYLWKTVVPLGLSSLYGLPIDFNPSDWPFVVSAMAVAAISFGLFFARKRWPASLACWTCYVVTLLPVLGIFQSGPQFAADRYTYLSCLGWALLAGAAVAYGWKMCWRKKNSWRRFALVSAVIVIGAGMASLTWNQAQVWHDSERLWRHVLSVDQNSTYAHNSLGNALFERRELPEAIDHFRRAIELNPAYARAHNNLGNALLVRGELADAIEQFREALRSDPEYAKAHYNLGVALARKGELADAIEQFREALRSDPEYAKAHYNLGVALARKGELAEAIEQFRQALRIQPESAETHENLGRALAQQGRRDEAVNHYEEAVRIIKSRPAPQVRQ